MVQRLDAILRRRGEIFEYSNEPQCLLRGSFSRADNGFRLRDGTLIRRGDPIFELHLWNEHVPRIGQEGTNIAFGAAMYRGAARAMEELAAYVSANADPRLAEIRAIHARTIFMPRNGQRQIARMIGTHGDGAGRAG